MTRTVSPGGTSGPMFAGWRLVKAVHYAPLNDVKLPPQLPDGGDLRRGGGRAGVPSCWGSEACCGRPDPRPQKYIAYESGVDPVGDGWSQSQIRYYVFALLFVMFDVETVFIFPWAVRLEALGIFGLVEAAAFIVILALGLLYAWRKGVLRWV